MSVERVTGLGIYEGALAAWIRDLKYRNQPWLARPLGILLGWAAQGSFGQAGPPLHRTSGAGGRARARWAPLVAPVPLHPQRLRARGYNQAALLAHAMGQSMGLKIREDLLVRLDAGRPQAGLSRADRLRLLDGAFSLGSSRAGQILRGKDVLLVDDVLTTGATLEACAECLLEAGAHRVLGCVVAVGVQRRLWA
ncbi:MAG: phosphoribosyltransferase family protein [Bacillota bacterium]|nr:phosphoribosyltransferase family protein [Bacillota bacterium]